MPTKVITTEYVTIRKKIVMVESEPVIQSVPIKTFPTRMPVITAPKKTFQSFTPSMQAIQRASSLIKN